MADEDSVLLQLGDGHNVHQLVAWHHSLRPIGLFQLITGGFKIWVKIESCKKSENLWNQEEDELRLIMSSFKDLPS